MKKQTITSENTLSANQVAALLETDSSNHYQHISLPSGISKQPLASKDGYKTTNDAPCPFSQLLVGKTLESTTALQQSTHVTQELSFGAPQLDLRLNKGELAQNTIHTFNPKHWRDQKSALTCAFLLAKRAQNQQTKPTPIFCFLTEEQNHLYEELIDELSKLNIEAQNLIIITSKHTDDQLWAIEETMHKVNGALIVAHFNLLQNIAAQRLKFIAQSQSCPCLLVCNHKIEGPNHAHSNWTISQREPSKEESLKITIQQSPPSPQEDPLQGILEWQANNHRFKFSNLEAGLKTPTLH